MGINTSSSGLFVNTTNVWDVAALQSNEIKGQELKELLIRLYQNINNISLVLNMKESGLFLQEEFITSQLYFPNVNNNSSTAALATNRPVYRTTINFGALPNAGTKSVAHNIFITPATTFTRIMATASDTTGLNYIPIPYTSNAAATAQVTIDVDATNVTIGTGTINRSNFTTCYVILEYIQS